MRGINCLSGRSGLNGKRRQASIKRHDCHLASLIATDQRTLGRSDSTGTPGPGFFRLKHGSPLRELLAASVAAGALAFGCPATAADLKLPTKAPYGALFDWTGFYIGAHTGYSYGSS